MFTFYSLETALAMKTLDCNWLKVQNEEEHRTDEYENPLLVLRRGQTFRVQVQFQRPYNKDFDKVMLQFRTGNNCFKILKFFLLLCYN